MTNSAFWQTDVGPLIGPTTIGEQDMSAGPALSLFPTKEVVFTVFSLPGLPAMALFIPNIIPVIAASNRHTGNFLCIKL